MVRRSHGTTLETAFYRARFDLQRGAIASLVEKASGRELVDKTSPYALGQFLHERFSRTRSTPFSPPIAGITQAVGNATISARTACPAPTSRPMPRSRPRDGSSPGPRFTGRLARLVAGDPRGLAEDITLYFTFPRHEAFVDVRWRVIEKTPNPIPEGGWLCFPFAVDTPQFTLGRLGAPIDPAKDIIPGTNRYLCAVSTGVAITGADKTGVALCPLDSPLVSLDRPGLWKWSLDFVPQRPTVFVNLYNNMWNTNFRFWQEGAWDQCVRFWPLSKGTNPVEDLAVHAWEARLPLQAATAGWLPGTLPASQTGLTLSRRGVLVTAFGDDPDGNPGTLLRVWEQSGKSGELAVTLPHGLKAT